MKKELTFETCAVLYNKQGNLQNLVAVFTHSVGVNSLTATIKNCLAFQNKQFKPLEVEKAAFNLVNNSNEVEISGITFALQTERVNQFTKNVINLRKS